jgi:hypothetical protein
MVSNLALLCLANVFATFQKIGRFFPNHLVTLSATERERGCCEGVIPKSTCSKLLVQNFSNCGFAEDLKDLKVF